MRAISSDGLNGPLWNGTPGQRGLDSESWVPSRGSARNRTIVKPRWGVTACPVNV